jgi:hypothetical protein
MRTSRGRRKRLILATACVGLAWAVSVTSLLTRQRPYPRGVQFSAPHRGVLSATLDGIWFYPYGPAIVGRLPQSWLPTVYAQSCSTPLCNYFTGEETNFACPGCPSGFYNQQCATTSKASYCTTHATTCTGGGSCTRADSTTNCN